MKFGIVKEDISSKKITAFIESFDKLRAHLKILYPDGVTFIENSDERSVRKNDSYVENKNYLLFNYPKATLYEKIRIPVEGVSGFIWNDGFKMNKLCSWELVHLDINDNIDDEPTPRTVEFRNFNIKSFNCGSMVVTYKNNSNDMNSLLATLLNKIDKDCRSDSLVISDKFTGEVFKSVEISEIYDAYLIDSKSSKLSKKIIFIDTSVGVEGSNYNHLLKIVTEAKNSNSIVIVLKQCDLIAMDLISSADHLMLVSTVDETSLQTIYNYMNITSLFSTKDSFVSIFKQLTSKFGTMIISTKRDPLEIVSWYRL